MADEVQPIEGYDEMTVAEIVDEMHGMSAGDVQAVKDYEADGKNRKGIMSYEVDADEAEEEQPLDPIVQSAIEAAALAAEGPADPRIVVDGTNRKHFDDGLNGHFVKVLAGEHKGRVGAFIQTLSYADDGYPEEILVRSRDADNILFGVPYEDVESAGDYRGGR
jgi:hypothetical protein